MPVHRIHAIAAHGAGVLALCACLLLAACAAPDAQDGRGSAAAAGAANAAVPSPADDGQAHPRPAKPPRMSAPLPPQRLQAPVAIDRSCRSDADCAVKDVGSCCGRQPACVNRDSPTDPAAVQAQCARDGMASTCGFVEVTACTCSAGQCQAAGGDAPVTQ